MKATIFSAALALTIASAAQAAPLHCTTNVNDDPRAARTDITVESSGDKTASVTEVTSGGMAHFVTAPKTFSASIKNVGPELVEYSNSSEDFELSVSFQPIGGKIRGTLTEEVQGRRVQSPVVCQQALN